MGNVPDIKRKLADDIISNYPAGLIAYAPLNDETFEFRKLLTKHTTHISLGNEVVNYGFHNGIYNLSWDELVRLKNVLDKLSNKKTPLKEYIKEAIHFGVADAFMGDRLMNELCYLKEFKLEKHDKIGDSDVWRYKFKSHGSNYHVDCAISRDKQGYWKALIDVYWRVKTKDATAGAGKDFTRTFGPYESFDDMCSELNRVLKNNPMLDTKNYHDDQNHMLDKESLRLLLKLRQNIDDIRKLNSAHLNSLVRIHDALADVPDEELLEKLKSLNNDWLKKLTLGFELQKVDKLPYYKSVNPVQI